MKRLLIAVALVLASTAAFAEMADRNVLVTPAGIVYSVEQATPSSSANVDATTILMLSVQQGTDLPQYMTVPETLKSGYNFGGTLVYDADTKTLFVMWVHAPNFMSTELLLAAYRDGKWQPAISIDNADYHLRTNLQLGITRRVAQLQKDGSYADRPALLLHALWWDESATGNEARYALLNVEKGAVTSIEKHSLEEFVDPASEPEAQDGETFNKSILSHPAIVSSPAQNSVDLVFGDPLKNSIHTVTLHPIADVRIHIPIGIGGGGHPSIHAPKEFPTDWDGPVTVFEHGDTLLFANTTEKTVNYLTYSGGTWSDVKSIALSPKLAADAAIAAVDKMVQASQ
jgi:hypothetical protein